MSLKTGLDSKVGTVDFHLAQSPHIALRGPEKLLSRLSCALNPHTTLRTVASIADIHGNIEGLNSELVTCSRLKVDTVIATGDFIDRDRQSLPVMQRVAELTSTGYMHALLGNHDLVATLAVFGSMLDLSLWLKNGGLSVLEEIGGDCGEIARQVRKAAAVHIKKDGSSSIVPKMTYGDAIEKTLQDDASLGNDCLKCVTANRQLNEIATWNATNLSLFEINEYGILYVHAGIASELLTGAVALTYPQNGETLKGLLALAAMDSELVTALKNRDLNAPVLEALRREKDSPLWVRGWHHPLMFADDARQFTNELGITSIVVGHTIVEDTISYGSGRVILADRGLAKAYNNQSGIVLASPDGSLDSISSSHRKLIDPTVKDNSLLERLKMARPEIEGVMLQAEKLLSC